MEDEKVLLSVRHITKTYPGVIALNDFSMDFYAGEVHALLGENGAGKSTLIKTVTGAIAPDGGEIVWRGESFSEMTPAQSTKAGISAIYQDNHTFGPLSVAENIFMGEKFGRLYRQEAVDKKARRLFAEYGVHLNPETPVEKLSGAQAQLLAIVRTISLKSKLVIMDEPTAPLTTVETDMLFRIIAQLKAKGMTVIYISHRIEEIFRIADRVTVMRDGELVRTLNAADTNRRELINLMVGRELVDKFPERSSEIGGETLRLENVTTDYVEGISFSVHSGEILGISGLVGSGRTEILQAVYGIDKIHSGSVFVNGEKVHIRSPRQAIACGIGIIPEDRKAQGVFMEMDVEWNVSFNNIRNMCAGAFLRTGKLKKLTEAYCERLRIKTPSIRQTVKNLSGGNQQKVAIAKTLAADSNILFFDEPTSGIDVGAKYEIYSLINELALHGKSIILISSEMEEILGMSDRIIVVYEGRITGELKKTEFSQEKILEFASCG